MKRTIKILLTLLLLNNATHLNAKTCTPCITKCNKTFLMPRSHGVDLALEYNENWRTMIYHNNSITKNKDTERFGAALQLGFFYDASTKENKLGRYFGPKCPAARCSNVFTFGAHLGTDKTITEDLDFRNFIHLPLDNSNSSLSATSADVTVATAKLTMNQRSAGFLLNYHQDLSAILKNLYIKFNIPITHVEHNIDFCLSTANLPFVQNTNGQISGTVTAATIKNQLEAYFCGAQIIFQQDDLEVGPAKLQEPLENGSIPKIVPSCTRLCMQNCPPGQRAHTGIADIDMILGYHVCNKNNYRLALNFGVTIPTSNESDAMQLWEPLVGNNGHWGLGLGYYGDMTLWESGHHKLLMLSALNYRYLLKDEELRLLGIRNQPWGQYRLLGKKDQMLLTPAANVLVRKMHVTPGSMVDFIVQGCYQFRHFGFDLGYNFYFREQECVRLTPCNNPFPDDTFAFPKKDFVGVNIGTADDPIAGHAFGDADRENGTWLSKSDVDVAVAVTPSQLTHKAYAGFSYTWDQWDVPCLVGAGGFYEFANGDDALELWGINVKMAIAF